MTTQTEKQLKLAILTAGILALLGMAWTSKADASTVTALASDVRVIKALVCKDHPGDSLCQVKP